MIRELKNFFIPTREYPKLHISTFHLLNSTLSSIKKLGSFAECFVFVLAMNDILYQHVTKPQLTSSIEGYDVSTEVW